MDFDGLPYVVPANSAAKKTERIKIKARFGQRKRLFINFQHRQKPLPAESQHALLPVAGAVRVIDLIKAIALFPVG